MNSDADVETFLSGLSNHVFVGSNAGGLKRLRSELLLLLRDQMDAGGEQVPAGLLLSSVIETKLRVRHTTVEARLGVGLVFLVSVATSGSSSHFLENNN